MHGNALLNILLYTEPYNTLDFLITQTKWEKKLSTCISYKPYVIEHIRSYLGKGHS